MTSNMIIAHRVNSTKEIMVDIKVVILSYYKKISIEMLFHMLKTR
jgi:glutaminase